MGELADMGDYERSLTRSRSPPRSWRYDNAESSRASTGSSELPTQRKVDENASKDDKHVPTVKELLRARWFINGHCLRMPLWVDSLS